MKTFKEILYDYPQLDHYPDFLCFWDGRPVTEASEEGDSIGILSPQINVPA
jgi:hypothetical protein